MAGTYQHYLQRMLQGGFKTADSGRKYPSVWVYRLGEAPKRLRIKKLGGEDEFYSQTSDGSTLTLDDRITSWEAHRQADIRAWRKVPDGTQIDAVQAAKLVGLTGARTRALRSGFKSMFEEVLPKFAQTLQDPNVIMAQIEDRMDLDEVIAASLRTELSLSEEEIADARGNPEFQAVMRMTKYALSDVLSYQFAKTLREFDREFSEAMESDAFNAAKLHGQAIETLLEKDGLRDDLLRLNWAIVQNASEDPWLLPDCAVMVISDKGTYSPFLFGNADNRSAILLPLSTTHMLVGVEPEQLTPDLSAFNANAARCAQDFFIAPAESEALSNYAATIGEAQWGEISDGMQSVLSGIDPLRVEPEFDAISPVQNLSVSTHGIDTNEDDFRAWVTPFCDLIFSTTERFDLNRLAEIVICGDVAAAIGARTGQTDLTYDPDSSLNSMTWIECGDGTLEYVFFIHVNAVDILLDTDHPTSDLAASLFYQSLAQFNTRAILGSIGADNSELFSKLEVAELGSYSRNAIVQAGIVFMDNVIGSRTQPVGLDYRQMVATRLEKAFEVFANSPLPQDGTQDERNILARNLAIAAEDGFVCAARLLAHCQTAGVDPLDPNVASPALREAITTLGLTEWLARLDFDLQRLRVNFGAPLDPERIKSLHGHFERLFWGRGSALVAGTKEEGALILPFSDQTINYGNLRLQMQDWIRSVLPDSLTQDFLKLLG